MNRTRLSTAWMLKLLSSGAVLTCIAGGSGCSGTVDGGTGTPIVGMPGAGGQATTGNGGQPAGTGADTPVPDPTATAGTGGQPPVADPSIEPVLDSGRTVLRRLTEAEYDNTVRDLLLTTMQPSDGFTAADTVAVDGFDTVGAVLTIPPVLVDQYEAAATKLVDELFARPAGDPARTAVLICEGTDDVCARSIVEALSKRAFRRPVEPAEVDRLMALKTRVDSLGVGAEEGLKAALKGVLLSPHFIFRVERSLVGNAAPEPISGPELATRLSYFLWSTMPDAELQNAGETGSLRATLSQQVQRMLEDEKAQQFVRNFAGQWLGIRHMEDHEPPSQLVFPEYDEELRDAAKQESLAFFESLLKERRPLTDLLTADYTIANSRLAQHYGITVSGGGFETVSLAQTPRRGFLTQASFLMNSSHPGSTSPTRRGMMVLERFLCQPIPPPPPDVEIDLPPLDPGMTRREQMAAHSSVPRCAGCHTLMDPIGFGFENFDAVGAYRTEENGATIDSSGMLPTPEGTTVPFNTPAELATLLAQDSRFAACVTEKLLTYAVGRSFTDPDARAYTAALTQRGLDQGKTDWRSWLEHIVTSEAFLTRRGEAQ